MGKNQSASGLTNFIQYDSNGNLSFVSGSTTLMQVSSSGAITTTGVISGSSVQSASLAQNSNLLQGTGSVGFATTGSFATASGSVSSRLTQIESVYATTGSNSFRANQSITGSLTVTGQIIAQTINVQQVTSSIVYSSGSNVFGCDINSTQTFTGSFYQTGSIANFSNRICSYGVSTGDTVYLNQGSALRFSGTCGYIYMFSRTAGGNCGAILINNGTGQNLWFGEVGANVYGFGLNPSGTEYSGTPILNMDILNKRVGINCSTPEVRLDIKSLDTTSETIARFYNAINAVCRFSQILVGTAAYKAGFGTMLHTYDTAYMTINQDPTAGAGIYYSTANKFGVNTFCPQTTLDVAGPARFHSNLAYGVGIAGSSGKNAGIGTITESQFNIYGNQSCDVVIRTGATWNTTGVDNTGTDKLRITSGNSIAGYSQWYTTYVKAVCTTDGGSQSVRFIEDSLGQWLLVGRFVANAAIAIQSTWSSVRGLSTSLAQDEPTAFSADWGGSCPSEIRIMGATDFCRWRETRTVDFIYKNIPGRPWCTFFNGGLTNGTYQTTGTVRFGWNTCGTYDGFGRWTNPFNCMIGMSDAAYCNPSSAYTTPTSNAFNWATAQDAKLTAIHYTEYSGQDVNETTGFGVDDSIRGYFDSYPSLTSNMATGDVFNSAAWILLKFS